MSTYHLHAEQRFATTVLVVGDGISAACAALEAAAAGKSTMLAASGPALAYELTVAYQGAAPSITDPHLAALQAGIAALGGVQDDWLDPDLGQLAVDRQMTERGVEVLLYATPLRVIARQGQAVGVLFGGKDGLFTIAASAVVDATEGGVLFRNSGVAFNDPATITAQRALFFQGAGASLAGLPASLAGFDLALRRTWPAEACATLTASAAYDGNPVPAALHQASRLAEQAVAATARAEVPGLQGAIVSHSGHRMLPLNGPALVTPNRAHPTIASFLGAGAWVNGKGFGALNCLASSGTSAGAAASAAAGPLPEEVTVSEDLDLPTEAIAVGVFGGGTGGPLAALSAALNGAQTVLFEAGWSLGGISSCGGIHCYYHGVPGGLQEGIDEATAAIADDFGGRQRVHGFHPEGRKLAFARAVAEAGAEVRYGWTTADVSTAGNRLAAVLLVAPGKLHLVAPTVAIDCTGDGDVAARAGAPMAYGRDADGLSHQYSQSAGRMVKESLGHYNFDAGYVDPRSIVDLTRGRREALQQYWFAEGYNGETRPFNFSYLLGLRQSRHIVGDYTLSLDDQVSNRHFDDVVAYGRCHQDNHAYDYQNENYDAMLWCWGLGYWKRMMGHEVPYRCLLPQGLSNVLMACRAVSVSREAHMLFRMIRDMHRLGEAAGTAAALALAYDGDVRAFPVAALQDRLRATGALLEDWPAPEPVRTPEALLAELTEIAPTPAVWHLYQLGEAAVPALQAGLQSDHANTRWWCAVSLAMIGKNDGAEVLLAALRERDPLLPTVNPDEPIYYLKRMASRWVTAMVLLGKLGERRAVPLLTAVLAETGHEADVLQAAVRALGRLGDPAAVAPLRQFIARDDLPLVADLQDSVGQRFLQPRDMAWELQLSTAEALQALGSPAPELVAPFRDDKRAYVREYAARLA